jgi:hypothetical protein
VKQATVVIDPTTMKGKDGKIRRAGWQVRTAFPVVEAKKEREDIEPQIGYGNPPRSARAAISRAP